MKVKAVQQEEMNFIDFMNRFQIEEDCRKHFFKRKKNPAVIALSLDDEGRPEHLKIEVAEVVNGENILEMTKETVAADARIRTDGLNACNILNREGYEREEKKFDPVNDPVVGPKLTEENKQSYYIFGGYLPLPPPPPLPPPEDVPPPLPELPAGLECRRTAMPMLLIDEPKLEMLNLDELSYQFGL
jgi:hypothetical protein